MGRFVSWFVDSSTADEKEMLGTTTFGPVYHRGFLHLIRTLFTNSENSDGMAITQKLFCEIEADYGMATAVGIYNEHLLLLCSAGPDEYENQQLVATR
ncbi:Chloroplast stem-loop binding protein of 41 kDa a, chloroplastic [Senna tora]|uniref:Chloroplast stem-loop binding protein of 41 kDa a, chloroplastic n=1 Tax=Senna tora TaxID=362788 RepID=A0A834TBL6_9FABA|nr:Chloroplast stem-loop binding protein of 41 kDa a, chloroplastic [Senna tora]